MSNCKENTLHNKWHQFPCQNKNYEGLCSGSLKKPEPEECSLEATLTPCSSSFMSCSVTLGVLKANRRHWTLSSGITCSSTSFRGSPRAVECFAVEGMASSRTEPLSVMSWKRGPLLLMTSRKERVLVSSWAWKCAHAIRFYSQTHCHAYKYMQVFTNVCYAMMLSIKMKERSVCISIILMLFTKSNWIGMTMFFFLL